MNIKELFSSFKVTVAPIPLSEKIRNGLIGGLAILLLGLALKHFPLSDYPPKLATKQIYQSIQTHKVKGILGLREHHWLCMVGNTNARLRHHL